MRGSLRQINEAERAAAYGALRMRMEGIMTGPEVVVLGYILAAFAIFGTTLAWVSSAGASSEGRWRWFRSAANGEAGKPIATRTATWQPRRS